MKVTQNTKIILDNKEYLLETGDEITINENLISRVLLSLVNKVIPIDAFKKLNPKFQSAFADVMKDPQKAKELKKAFKENPGLFNLFT